VTYCNESIPDRLSLAIAGDWQLQSAEPSQLIPVVSGQNVGGMDAAVEPTGRYSRRFVEEMIGIINW